MLFGAMIFIIGWKTNEVAMIYNHLFLHGYLLALSSKSNKDMPFFVPFMLVLLCFIMHLFTIILFINGATNSESFFKQEHRYYWVVTFMIVISLSYLYKGRYKSILAKAKSNKAKKSILNSVFIILLYYFGSAGMMLLAALYKNKDWIFN
jgi:hypothetical protein